MSRAYDYATAIVLVPVSALVFWREPGGVLLTVALVALGFGVWKWRFHA